MLMVLAVRTQGGLQLTLMMPGFSFVALKEHPTDADIHDRSASIIHDAVSKCAHS